VAAEARVLPDGAIPVLDHGFVRLDGSMATDLSVVNSARVSFGRRKEELEASDGGLIRFLMRERHGTPFEHNSFRFHVRTPIFVAREWFRHRIGCLTGDTVVTFVDSHGHASADRSKTIEQLWRMWTQGERNPHALRPEVTIEVERLAALGYSIRAIARQVGAGRTGVRSHLRGANGFRDARWRVRRMRLRVLNEQSGEFEAGHVAEIVDKGVQPVYRLTLADGKALTCTETHRLLTSEGWLEMGVAVGLVRARETAAMSRPCAVMTNGVPVHRDREWMQTQRAAEKSVREIAEAAGCSYHTIRKLLALHDLRFTRTERYRSRVPWNKGRHGYSTRLVVGEAHREAIRRARSGVRSNFWRGGVATDRASIARWTREKAPQVHHQFDYTCQSCGTTGGKLHAHHIAPVWLDPTRARAIGNLISVCHACHRLLHRTREAELSFLERFAGKIGFAEELAALPTRRGWKLTAHAVPVVSLEYVGLRQTYDLCVDGPGHNFLANGVVVHNSFNEFSLRYAKATDDFYVPEPDDVRTQVGKPGAYSFEPVPPEVAEQTRDELRAVYEQAFATYERLVELGVARELARCVIPVGSYTEFYWTVNARALMNFVSLRNAETAQREIRRYADAVERLFAEQMPVTHAAFVANGRIAP
jgi:thymidylate synthase (FAD)